MQVTHSGIISTRGWPNHINVTKTLEVGHADSPGHIKIELFMEGLENLDWWVQRNWSQPDPSKSSKLRFLSAVITRQVTTRSGVLKPHTVAVTPSGRQRRSTRQATNSPANDAEVAALLREAVRCYIDHVTTYHIHARPDVVEVPKGTKEEPQHRTFPTTGGNGTTYTFYTPLVTGLMTRFQGHLLPRPRPDPLDNPRKLVAGRGDKKVKGPAAKEIAPQAARPSLMDLPNEMLGMILDELLLEGVTVWNTHCIHFAEGLPIKLNRVNKFFRETAKTRYWSHFAEMVEKPCQRVLAYKFLFMDPRTEKEIFEASGLPAVEAFGVDAWDQFDQQGRARCVCGGQSIKVLDLPIEL